MKTRPMSNTDVAEFRRRFTYEPHTGVIRNRQRWSGSAPAGAEAGTIHELLRGGPRRIISVGGVPWRSARVAFAIKTGVPVPQGKHVDHINGAPLDDRWVNLRLVTPAQNSRNKRKMRNNKSGVVGVCWSGARNRWTAEIRHGGRRTFLGNFDNLHDAARARQAAEAKYHGEFAASKGVLAK